MKSIKILTNYYESFDANYTLDVPAEGFGGWKKAELEINAGKTAVVAMHIWDCGTMEEYPGWFRATEFIPRAYKIVDEVFPPLLDAIRKSPLKLYHVVTTPGYHLSYYKDYPGYKRALELAGPEPTPPEKVESDPFRDNIFNFKNDYACPGKHNADDIARGVKKIGFSINARPTGDEGIAENTRQLDALCRKDGINHLIYIGFALEWCLLISEGGMNDMWRRGYMCSTIRQAVTSCENKESAKEEYFKQLGLWRVDSTYGLVYDADDFINGISKTE